MVGSGPRDFLPVPFSTPLEHGHPAVAALTPFEARTLTNLRNGQPLYLLLRTRTRVDVGLWFRRRCLWLAAMPEELLLFAVGRGDHVERYRLDRIQASFHNPITGELVLAAPRSTTILRTLRISADEARQVLAQIAATTKEF